MLQCSEACVFTLTGVHSSYHLPPARAMCPLLVNTGAGPVSKPPDHNQLIMFSPLTNHMTCHVFLPSSLIMEMVQLFPCEQACKSNRTVLQTKKGLLYDNIPTVILRCYIYSHLPPGSLIRKTQLCGLALLFREKYN